MKKLIPLLFIPILFTSCEKLSRNISKNIVGTYQGQSIILNGIAIDLPNYDLGLNAVMTITELDKTNVGIFLEMTVDGETSNSPAEFFNVRRDGSVYKLGSSDFGYFDINENGEAIIEDVFEDGAVFRIMLKRL